jgi:hypothetical protein
VSIQTQVDMMSPCTGVTMPFEKLTSDRLSTLPGEVLKNPVYRENTRKFQDMINKTNGLSIAADKVERSFGVIQNLKASWRIRTAGKRSGVRSLVAAKEPLGSSETSKYYEYHVDEPDLSSIHY